MPATIAAACASVSLPAAVRAGTWMSMSPSGGSLSPQMIMILIYQSSVSAWTFLWLRAVMKDVLERPSECPGDAKGEFQRRRVARRLDGDDGLARYAHALGELLLRHLAMIEPQPADAVGDERIHVDHAPRR